MTAKRFLAGDERAASEVYGAYRGLVYFLIGSLLDNKEDRDDVYQETFLRLLRSKEDIKRPEALESYLLQTAKNLSYEVLRKKRVEQIPETLYECLGQEDTRGFYDEIEKALPRRELFAFMLAEVYGYSVREIASFAGISKSSIARDLKRAKEILKEKYRNEKEN